MTVTRRDGSTETVTPSGQTIDLRDLGDLVTVRVNVPGLAAGTNLVVQVAGRADASELPGGSGDIDNCARLDLTGDAGTADEESCTSFHLEPEVSQPELSKSTDPTPVGPGGTHTWTITLRNDRYRTGSSPLRPRFVDLVPRQLAYVKGSWALADGQPDYCPAADRFTETVTDAADGRTRVELTAAPGAEIPADDSSCVYAFRTTVEPGIASGTYGGSPADADYQGNRAGLYDAERPVNTRGTDTHDIDGDGDTSENVAEATDDFAIAESSALFVTKEVKGDEDDAFKGSAEVPGQEDEVGRSTIGGTVEYRTVLGNMGNTALTNVVAYDLLPAPRTTGVTSGRYGDDVTSQWRPTLTGPIAVGGAPVTLTYSTEADPCRPEMDNTPDDSAPFQCDGRPDPSFVPADQVTDFSRVRSLRFDFNGHVFSAGERYTLRWLMAVPQQAAGGEPFEGGERTWKTRSRSLGIGGRGMGLRGSCWRRRPRGWWQRSVRRRRRRPHRRIRRRRPTHRLRRIRPRRPTRRRRRIPRRRRSRRPRPHRIRRRRRSRRPRRRRIRRRRLTHLRRRIPRRRRRRRRLRIRHLRRRRTLRRRLTHLRHRSRRPRRRRTRRRRLPRSRPSRRRRP
ncbi:hypothetical protein RB200_13880 [Streptomyces sp. PmtG]